MKSEKNRAGLLYVPHAAAPPGRPHSTMHLSTAHSTHSTAHTQVVTARGDPVCCLAPVATLTQPRPGPATAPRHHDSHEPRHAAPRLMRRCRLSSACYYRHLAQPAARVRLHACACACDSHLGSNPT